MSNKSFRLEIVTPEATVYDGQVTSITLPTVDGEIGILANHAALVTAVDIGGVTVVEADGDRVDMFVSDGFFEVANNHARLLADVGERAGDIAMDRAEEAEKRARERLESGQHDEIDFDRVRAMRSLQRALWRQRLARGRNA
ncbi:MAG: ATP synthase F1 subunit epsilon [Planctomycetota bacterium]